MSPRVGTAVCWLSLGCAALSVTLYYLLWMHFFRDSWIYEGWIFLAQVAFAVLGLLLAVAGLRHRTVVCLISGLVNGYLVLIQLFL